MVCLAHNTILIPNLLSFLTLLLLGVLSQNLLFHLVDVLVYPLLLLLLQFLPYLWIKLVFLCLNILFVHVVHSWGKHLLVPLILTCTWSFQQLFINYLVYKISDILVFCLHLQQDEHLEAIVKVVNCSLMLMLLPILLIQIKNIQEYWMEQVHCLRAKHLLRQLTLPAIQ